MLTTAKKIKGFKLRGIDGEVGSIREFFFDDKFWTIRYLVANTGGLFNRKEVLISPYFLMNVSDDEDVIHVNLTKSEIENSPSLESEMPVSRRYEEAYYGYYGAPVYWGGPSMWGSSETITHDREKWNTMSPLENSWDPNLQSSKDVTGHNIQATDGEIGHVEDFIIDDDNWAIRYLVLDTKNFLPGKKVLISPQWIERIDWVDSKVFVDLSRESIKHAPEYDADKMLTRENETRLHDYYKRKGYWSDDTFTHESSRRHFRSGQQ